jgi:hypothetical protein
VALEGHVTVTLARIRAEHASKREYERWLPLSRWGFRPVAFALTWLAIRAGLSGEAVSWLSAAVGLAGCALLVVGLSGTIAAGLALLILFNLLDCVDGGIARTLRSGNPYGRFLDSACGALVDLPFWAVVGVLAFRHPFLVQSALEPHAWLAAGAVAAFLAAALLLVDRAWDELLAGAWSARDARDGAGRSASLITALRHLDRNARVRETHYVLLAMACWARAVDVFLTAFLVYYAVRLLTALAVYARRGRAMRDARRDAPSRNEPRVVVPEVAGR